VPGPSKPLEPELEAGWLARLRLRDPDAEQWYAESHRDGLYRTAVYFLGWQDSDAEDLVQETLVKGLVKLEGFEGRSKLSTWLNQICVHLCYERLRQRQRLAVGASKDLLETLSVQAPGGQPDVLHQLLDQEKMALLRRGLEGLGGPCREIIQRRDLEGQAYVEAARAMKLPMGTFTSRLLRCRERLRQAVRQIMDGV
jgi:RNA polymerase sigma factor (sigma-70 family)